MRSYESFSHDEIQTFCLQDQHLDGGLLEYWPQYATSLQIWRAMHVYQSESLGAAPKIAGAAVLAKARLLELLEGNKAAVGLPIATPQVVRQPLPRPAFTTPAKRKANIRPGKPGAVGSSCPASESHIQPSKRDPLLTLFARFSKRKEAITRAPPR